MARKYVFVDEAGNFDFSARGSKYFILTSIALDACTIGDELLELRRQLIWEGVDLNDAFHATTDKQLVRDRVFAVIARHEFRVDSTVFEKQVVFPHLHSESALYEFAWYLHFHYIAPRITTEDDELMVVGASIGTRKRQKALSHAVAAIVRQVTGVAEARTAYRPAATDPCLQVADYCCWAIQRKWERNDMRSHVLISDKIASEFSIFRRV